MHAPPRNAMPRHATKRPRRAPQVAAPAFAVELEGLTKVYGGSRGRTPEKRALDGVDLAVPRGSFFALLGPNGAGKSTLINILAGLVVKTAGTARVFGVDIDARPRRARRVIGVVPQELNLDAFFTPRETLELQAGLYGVPVAARRTDEILRAVGLADKADAYARSLSGGMRRRLLVAKALVHRPPVVILDEPTAGVDVELRRSLWAYMQELNRGASPSSSPPTISRRPRSSATGSRSSTAAAWSPATARTRFLRRLDRRSSRSRSADPARHLCRRPCATRVPTLDAHGRIVFRYRPSGDRVGRFLEALRAADIAIADLATREADLEELFLRLTGERRQSQATES